VKYAFGIMSLKMIQVLECVFAICAILGLVVDSVPSWERWLCWFLFVGLDTWRCLKVGEISTGPDWKWYGFTFDRDESPEIFTVLVVLQMLVTLVLFFIFLSSL
jgi:hypothetical protein